jgi:hypothetical protein
MNPKLNSKGSITDKELNKLNTRDKCCLFGCWDQFSVNKMPDTIINENEEALLYSLLSKSISNRTYLIVERW